MRNPLRKLLLLLCMLSGMSANAASFDYAATITSGDGALPMLIPIGSPVSGYVSFEAPAVTSDGLTSATITSIKLLIASDTGQPFFCLAFDVICAVNEGTFTRLVGVTAMQLEFDLLDQPIAGVIDAEIFSPTLFLSIPVQLDLIAGTFSLSANGIGYISGPGHFQLQPVPLPASLMLFASALAVLQRRTRAKMEK